jgi:hypothetical protein
MATAFLITHQILIACPTMAITIAFLAINPIKTM